MLGPVHAPLTASRDRVRATRPQAAVAQLLVRCVTEHDWGTAPEGAAELAAVAGLDRVAAAARFHGVTGCVHRSLAPVLEPIALAALAADEHRAIDLHVRALGDLAGLSPVLNGLGARWLVVKGPVLAETYYSRPDLRTYNDLDVVVPGPALGAVLAAVEGAGATLLDRNWARLQELQVAELLLRLRYGTLLDLHWRLFNYPAVRRTFRTSLPELLERARPVSLGALVVSTLDPTDTLLHLSAHGTLSGGHRLVWLKDVERAIATDTADWDELVSRARSWGIGPAAALALARARSVLGAPVPDGVPEAVAGGRAYLAAGALADRLAPPARSRGNRSIALLVSRSARTATADTAAEMGRRLVAVVRGMDLSLSAPANDMDPASPRSPRHDPGSDVGRSAFLAAAALGNG